MYAPAMTRTLPGIAFLAAAALALSACGSDDASSSSQGAATATSTPAATSTTVAAACDKGSLATRTSGRLTIGTDKPAYPPYFEDNDPTNGKGFESAVAYAVAK